MQQPRKTSFVLPLFFALLAIICLISGLTIFAHHNNQISFHEKIKSESQILVENLVERAINILHQNDKLKTEITKGTRHIANEQIDQYNKLANEYNRLNKEIDSSSFFNNNLSLKKQFLETNNEAFKFLDSTRTLLSDKKSSTAVSTPSVYFERYAQLNQHPSVTEFSLFSFNRPTFLFFLSIMGLSLFSLVSIWLFYSISTKLKNTLVQKESELKTFLSVIDNMSEGVVVSDRFGFFTYYNQSALEIIGSNVKDIYYQSSLDLIGFYNMEGQKLLKNDSPFHKAVKKDIVTDQEIFVRNRIHPEGIYISASNGFFVDEKGETLGAVVVMKNISHKKQLEELWKKERQVAIEGSQKKSDFLASMSHEIRTPMNGIIGLTTLLSESKLDEQQSEFVSIIRRSAYSLLALINDILDHSKIEAGKIELIQTNFDLSFLIKDVLENFRLPSTEKNNQMHLDFPENVNKYYVADENRIRQILINLVGNASKFTSNGSITIKAELLQDRDKESLLRISVTDTGPGMDQKELDRLFQRFFQTKTGIKFGGTGLGLSICKQLVDLMKGRIGVTSEPGKGSTFWFELNLQKGSNQSNATKNIKLSDFNNSFAGHILVAEDNIINQKVVQQYLSKLGFTADIANNGAEAFEMFQTHKYDLVLMDCNMPVLNGYEATKKINELQKHKSSHQQIKVVALTAEGQVTGLNKCLEAGMSDFINKPIMIEEFVAVIKKYFGNFDKTSLHKLKELTVGNDLLLEVLFQEYSQSTPEVIKNMHTLADNNDFNSLSDVAHSLKSASGSLGAKKVQVLCQSIENVKNGVQDTDLKSLLTELEREFHLSLKDIQNEIQNIKSLDKKAA